MKPIEVKINIDELYAIKSKADAMEVFQKTADENESKANRLVDEVTALRAELDAKKPDCNDIPVMPKDIAGAFKMAEKMLRAEDDSRVDSRLFAPGKDDYELCVRDLVASIAKYFTTPRGGAK